MRGWNVCLLLTLAGCCRGDVSTKSESASQPSEQCADGDCCSKISRSAILRKSVESSTEPTPPKSE